jgi:hypothetical protein
MRVWFCAYKQWFPVRCNTAAHVHRRRPIGTANAAVPGRRTEGQAVCVGTNRPKFGHT